MNYLVVLVVNDIDDCPAVLDAWDAVGVPGSTILPSTGIGHIRRAGLLDNIPLMPNIQDLFEREEIQHQTIFSVVDNQEMVDKMVASARQVIGDLDEAHTGFLFVVPVLQAYGMGSHRPGRKNE